MNQPPTSIEFVVRIGDTPPPPAALDRWPDATWSHHADPLDGLVELGRRVFESRADRTWAAETRSRIATLVTLRESAAELAAAIASHLPEIELLIASPSGDLLAIDGDACGPRTVEDGDDAPARPPATPESPASVARDDSRTVSSDEIRMLLGDADTDRIGGDS